MTAPGDFSSGAVLTAADMNDLPGAVMGYNRNASPPNLTTSEQTLATVTFTAVAGRLYLLAGNALCFGFNAAGVFIMRLKEGSDRYGEFIGSAANTTQDVIGGTVSGFFTGSGSTTIDLVGLVAEGASSATTGTNTNADPYLIVVDVGPS